MASRTSGHRSGPGARARAPGVVPSSTSISATFTVLVLAAVLAACGSSPRRPHANASLLTRDEIAQASGPTALDVLQQLRPQFLRHRGQRTLQRNNAANEPVIYVDDVRTGGVESLRSIRTMEIEEIRYLTPAEATTRYGTGHLSGAIAIALRRS